MINVIIIWGSRFKKTDHEELIGYSHIINLLINQFRRIQVDKKFCQKRKSQFNFLTNYFSKKKREETKINITVKTEIYLYR